MRARRDLFEHQADQALAAVVEQFRRSHRSPDNDSVLWKIGNAGVTRQVAQKTTGEVIEVMSTLAKNWIAKTLDANSRFVLHAFNRRLGRQSRSHGIAHALEPTL